MTASTAEGLKGQKTSVYVTDLRLEIGHTDSYEFREELKGQRAFLEDVLRRVGGPVVAGQGEAR